MWEYTKTLHFFLLLPILVIGQKPIFPDFPSPRIVLVGPTGSGKSSLGNALLGCDPRLHECMFFVCDGIGSCTKETKIGTGKWLGTGVNVTIVDTPGFGDTDNQDEEHIEEMMDILANSLEHADTFVLLLKGTTTRFDEGLQVMLDRMTMMFGRNWWDFVVIGVSFWAYDQDSIDGRECFPDFPDFCKDEAWFSRNLNTMAQERFGVQRNFTFAFMDSWSQTAGPPTFNTDDPLQQAHWKNETDVLWNETDSREEIFKFMTINDFIEENTRQKAEIKWLNDVITNNISQLNDHLNDLNKTVDNHNDVITNEISQLNEHLDDLYNTIDHLRSPPIGAIEAWFGGTEVTLPEGWMKCDHSVIPSGPFKGKRTPNLNGENGYFLRGGPTDMDFNGITQEDQIKNHVLSVHDPGHVHRYAWAEAAEHFVGGTTKWGRQREWGWEFTDEDHFDCPNGRCTGIQVEYEEGGDETRPKSFSVEWIIRIY